MDAVAFSPLRHRAVLNFQAEAEGMGIQRILALGTVPSSQSAPAALRLRRGVTVR